MENNEKKDTMKDKMEEKKEKDPFDEALEIIAGYYEGCSKPVSEADGGE